MDIYPMLSGIFEFLHALVLVYLYSPEVGTTKTMFAMNDRHSPSHCHRIRLAYSDSIDSLLSQCTAFLL